MWLKHHSWQQLFCTESLQVKICVAAIVICFLGHRVEMMPLLAAPLVYVLSTVQFFFCVYECAKRVIWQKNFWLMGQLFMSVWIETHGV